MNNLQKLENFNNLKNQLLDYITKELPNDINAFYFFGSLFNGQYTLNSDYDFICLLKRPINTELILKINKMIKYLISKNNDAKLLEGTFMYLNSKNPWDSTMTLWKGKNEDLILEEDSLTPDLVDFIVSKGLSLYGEKPQKVLPYVSSNMLLTFSKDYITKTQKEINNTSIATNKLLNKLLNSCSSSYYIANGNFGNSKIDAAKWAMKKFPTYNKILEKALQNHLYNDKNINLSVNEKQEIMQLLNLMKNNTIVPLKGLNMPIKLEIQMTTACNCNCPQCGYFTINKLENISIETIHNFISSAINYFGWIDRVLYEGGEPTMDYQKLLTCIDIAKNLGIPNIQINSNFINLTKKQINELVSHGCNYFEISVDAITEETWNNMRGISNLNSQAYYKFIDNLKYACELPGVTIDFNYTPTIYNIDEFSKVYEFACEIGARYFSFQNLVCTTEKINNIKVPTNKLALELKKIQNYFNIYSFPPTILLCCLEAMKDGNELENLNFMSEQYKCSCGEQYLYLNHKGDIRMCCFGDGLYVGKYDKNFFEKTFPIINSKNFTGCPVINENISLKRKIK